MYAPNGNWMISLCGILAALLGATTISVSAAAEPAPISSYTTFDATPGERLQLGYYAFANNDCTPARRPTIRVIEFPSAGVLTVRTGELTMNSIAGCLQYRTSAQITFYEARKGDADLDQVTYEVTNPNGDVEVHQIKIRIRSSSGGR